jgi:hypothetical protein
MYGPAYIEVVELKMADGNEHPSMLQFEPNEDITNPFVDLDDSQDLPGSDKEKYWYHFLIMAYQGPSDGDTDPDGEEPAYSAGTGVTISRFGVSIEYNKFSALFEEVIRDSYTGDDDVVINRLFPKLLNVTVAHECAHPPGGFSAESDHLELGIMKAVPTWDDDRFTAKTIRRLRQTTRWYP